MKYTTGQWVLETPEGEPGRGEPSVVLATIHPRGDQRILKCIQSILDHRCTVHVIWLGEEPQGRRFDGWLKETVLPAPISTRQRLLRTFAVLRVALGDPARILYIHDYYMLPHAWVWRVCRPRRSAVVFDSHEFYSHLYAQKFPPRLRRIAFGCIQRISRVLYRCVDAFSVVSESMLTTTEMRGRPVIVTPNFPSTALFPNDSNPAELDRMNRIIHSGSLSLDYGARVLVQAAKILEERGAAVEIHAIERFSSEASHNWFEAELRSAGNPSTLTMIPIRNATEMQVLLEGYGAGLSLIQDEGQNSLAIPTKIYEYAVVGLFVVASDVGMQARFVSESPGVAGACFNASSASQLADCVESLISRGEEVAADLAISTACAKSDFSWEESCAPQFSIFRQVYQEKVDRLA